MDEDEFIDILRNIVETYDINKKLNEENMMWRERFLATQPKLNDIEKAACEWNSFLFLPPNSFKNPEKTFSDIRKALKNHE